MTTPTPETDSFERDYDDCPLLRDACKLGRKLERERDGLQIALDKSATQLLEAINSRNSIGVQLDLIRDELLRIMARIAETGLIDEHHGLRSIFDYCQRAQKDIEVLYTPIQERDKAKSDLAKATDFLDCALRERDAWKAKAERTCVVKQSDFHGSFYDTQCGDDIELEHGDLAENGYRFCPFCGGRIVKEEE